MPQPVILVIDDDAGVTVALSKDLDRRFGEDFRVIGETSATAGLATLRKLAEAGEPVALLIVDHDLSAMPGAAPTAPRTSCGRYSPVSTCRSASTPRRAGRAASCSATSTWTPGGSRS